MPEAIVIAGANGSGKTTFARQFLAVRFPAVSFLNVDEISTEASTFAHPVAAGREFLRRLDEAERQQVAFAIETTLSSRMYSSRMIAWKTLGYSIYLHFLELPSEDYAVQRVAKRVAAGGHSVPESDVRRRFRRGLVLFERLYKPLVDDWYHWYSDDGGMKLVQYSRR